MSNDKNTVWTNKRLCFSHQRPSGDMKIIHFTETRIQHPNSCPDITSRFVKMGLPVTFADSK